MYNLWIVLFLLNLFYIWSSFSSFLKRIDLTYNTKEKLILIIINKK